MATWSKEVFAANLRRYMEQRGKSQKELAEIAGVSAPTMHDWLKAKKYPRIDKIEMLANYFGILKSDLIEEKSEEHKKMQEENNTLADIVVRLRMDSDFMSVVEDLHSLDETKFAAVRQMLSAFMK